MHGLIKAVQAGSGGFFFSCLEPQINRERSVRAGRPLAVPGVDERPVLRQGRGAQSARRLFALDLTPLRLLALDVDFGFACQLF